MDGKNIQDRKKPVDFDMLFRSFNNVATEEEETLICEWLAGNEENKKTYGKVRDLHEAFVMEAPLELLEKNASGAARKRRKSLHTALQFIGYAAVLAVFCVAGYVIINNRVEARLAETINTIEVPAGKSMDYVLADGTVIKMNSGARLQYPAAFAKDRREVHLDGEAYFDVSHNEKQPFVVRTFASDITVLGTEFNVNADKTSGTFSATLIDGSIRLSNHLIPGEQIVMHPNEKVTLVKDHMILKEYEASKDILWTEGVLDIGGLGFDDLMKKLEMAFGIKIVVNREMSREPVFANAKLRISDGIDKALEVIGNGVEFIYRRDPKTGTVFIE